jgi:hypothetical protein
MTLLKDISRLGSRRQCSFSKIVCFDCGVNPGISRGSPDSFRFVVCDDCFKSWVFLSKPTDVDAETWGVFVVKPFHVAIMGSVTLSDAVECLIDLAGCDVDKVWSKNWKKTRLKRLLRVGVRSY